MRDVTVLAEMTKACRNKKYLVGLEVPRAMNAKTSIFWVVMPCSSEKT
jgi:hypothetical protein